MMMSGGIDASFHRRRAIYNNAKTNTAPADAAAANDTLGGVLISAWVQGRPIAARVFADARTPARSSPYQTTPHVFGRTRPGQRSGQVRFRAQDTRHRALNVEIPGSG